MDLRNKKIKPPVLLIGGAAIGLAAVLIVYALLIATGVVSGRRNVLVFSARSVEKEYDGTPLEADGWVISGGKLKNGHHAELTVEGSQTAPGEGKSRITSIIITDELGNDVTSTYEYELRDGSLTVLRRKLVLWSGDAEKDYDGSSLWNNHWGYESGWLLDDHYLNISLPASITEVGTAPNEIVASVEDDDGNDVTYLYELIFHPGTLTVYGRHLTVTSASATKIYDGQPLTAREYAVTAGTLFAGHTLEVDMNSERTDAGESDNVISVTVRDRHGNDVTDTYELECVFGTLLIERADLVVASGDARKPYDGTPLTCAQYTVTRGAVAAGHTIVMNAQGWQTEVGRSTNTFSIRIKDADGKDVTVNYDVMLRPGKLVVYDKDNPYADVDYDPSNPGDVTIDPGDITFDPGDISIDPGDITFDPGDFTLDPDVTLDPGEYPPPSDPIKGDIAHSGDNIPDDLQNVPIASIRSDASGMIYLRYASYGDYTGTGWTEGINAADTETFFTSPFYLPASTRRDFLSMARLSVQCESPLDRLLVPYYPFGGLPDTLNDVSIPSDGMTVYGITYCICKQELPRRLYSPGSAATATERAMKEYAYKNYTAVPESTRAVMQRLAKENGLDPESWTVIQDVADYISNAIVYNKQMEPIPMNTDMVVWVLTEGGEGICQHFASAAVLMYRTLGIPARYVTGFRAETVAGEWVDVTAARAHAWVEVYIDGCGWTMVEVTGGRRDQAEDDNTDRLSLGLTANSASQIYNGKALRADGYTCTSGALRPGDSIQKVVITGSQTLPGESEARITDVKIVDASGEDVTHLYDIALRPGTLTVRRIPLTVVSPSAQKYYDGTPLTAPTCTYNESVLLPGHFLLAEAIGSITEVGQIPNEIVAMIFDSDGNDMAGYYDMQILPGVLTVKEVPLGILTIRTASATQTYNGKPLSDSGWELISGTLCVGHFMIVKMNSSRTDVGVCVNKPVVTIIDWEGNDVTSRYVLETSAYGLLTVQPALLIVTSHSAQSDNPSRPLICRDYDLDDTYLVPGHQVLVQITGMQQGVGMSVNTIEGVRVVDSDMYDVTANYTIRLVQGTLTVTESEETTDG